jgi:hypothetical protein
MKKVVTILVIIILFSRIVTFAQQVQMPPIDLPNEAVEKGIKAYVDKSTYVIEGKLLSQKEILTPAIDGGDGVLVGSIYELLLIKPTVVLKGNVDTSTTFEYLVHTGGYTMNDGYPLKSEASDIYGFWINDIYFFSAEIKPPDYCQPYTNATHVNFLQSLRFKDFKNGREALMKFFEEKLNIKPILLDDGLEKKSPNESEIAPIKPKINPVNFKKSPTDEKSGRIKHIGNTGLYLEIANDAIVGTNLEFDILIVADAGGTYLDNCVMDLYFSNSVGNYRANLITYSVDPYYADPSYVERWFDNTSNVVHVQFGSDSGSTSGWHRAEVQTTVEPFLHFSVPDSNCYETSYVSFQEIPDAQIESYYTDNPDDDIFTTGLLIQYGGGTTNYSGSIDSTYCHHLPDISGFSPTTIYPGNYYPGNPTNKEQMTIEGVSFGTTQGKVFMRDADNGGTTYDQLDARDILLWSDNSIIVNVPSYIDSIPGKPGIGSGTFYIQTYTGEIASSFPSSVSCPYSIQNRTDIGQPFNPKLRINEVNKNHSGSITFRLDTSITNYPDTMLIPTIRQCIQEWDCAININFLLDTVPIADNGFLGDTICTIFLADSLDNPSALAETVIIPRICTDPSGTIRYIFTYNIKIGILRDLATASTFLLGYTWQCQPDSSQPIDIHKVDLHGVLLHEFGHACLQNHVNQSSDLMYYTEPNAIGPVDPWNRMKITIPDNIEAGVDVVVRSASIIYLPACQGPLIPGTLFCLFEDHIKEINQNVSSIKIYPNPIDDDLLNVAFDIKQDAPVNFIILDNLGKEVLNFNKNESAGEHTEQLNLNHLAVGVYYLEVIINGIGDSGEIMKIR